MQLVRTRLGDDVDRRRAVAAELGGEVVGREPELLNQVDVRIDGGAAGRELVVVVGAIEQEVVRAIALAVDECGIASRRASEHHIPWIGGGAGLQLHQLERVASVQWQLGDTLLVHEVREAALFGVHKRRVPLHLNRLSDRADAHHEIEADGLPDRQQDAGLRQRLEPLQLRLHLVGPARQVRDAVLSITLRNRRPRVVRADIPRRDRHAWQHAAARVFDGSGEICARCLRKRGRGQQQQGKEPD